MKPQSAKAKGRLLQQQVSKAILKAFPFFAEEDVVSRPMGSGGIDIMISEKVRAVFPYAVECKNQESLNIWKTLEQCVANAESEGLSPVVVFKRNRSDTYAALPFMDFMDLNTMLLEQQQLINAQAAALDSVLERLEKGVLEDGQEDEEGPDSDTGGVDAEDADSRVSGHV